MDEDINYSNRIKALRKKAGLTQKELAYKTGLAEITIRQYESGKRQPRLEQLRNIASILGVSIGDLVDDWTQFSKNEIEDDLDNNDHKQEVSRTKQVSRQDRMTSTFCKLNDIGQEKAIEQVELLIKIPEYQKGNSSE